MKKEIIIAILLGLSLGLFITYGLYRTRNAADTNQTLTIEDTLNSSPEIEVLSTLVLHSPEDESIVENPEVPIAGDTEPNNFVVIFVNEEEFITTADETGAFSISTELEAGSNVIIVYSIDEDGNQTIEERVVIYSTRPLTEDENGTENEETTEENDQEATEEEDA
jgi:hypothetical protein